MTTVPTQCMFCRHFDTQDRMKNACAAFPDGIPPVIILNRHDHREPYDGDNGIRFEPLPGERHPADEEG